MIHLKKILVLEQKTEHTIFWLSLYLMIHIFQ